MTNIPLCDYDPYMHTPAAEPDTYTWLATLQNACPACGQPVAPDAPACPACRRSLVVTVKPAERSQTTLALTGAWSIAAIGGLLALIGAGTQIFGIAPQTNSTRTLQLLTAGNLALLSVGAVMAWACWNRRPPALYCGLALSLALALIGIGAGLLIGDMLGLTLLIVSLLLAAPLILMHIALMSEFRGEQRRQVFEIRGRNARELYIGGRESYRAGLRFLAAQHWARAISKSPGEVEYIHALGLVLLELGHHQRALGQFERALHYAPNSAELRRSYDLARQKLAQTSDQAGSLST